MTEWKDRIRAQLRRLVGSATFAKATRLRKFLDFVVEHAVEHPNESLKEITIGIELYAIGHDFDPRLSSVVRVDATRLRSKLLEYYSTEGSDDSLVIDLPKGSYTPIFRESRDGLTARGATNPVASGTAIAVLPFSNLSPDPEEYFSDGLAEEIIHALSSVDGIRVVARSSAFVFRHRASDVREIGRALNVGFVLEGSIRKSGKDLRVNVQLVNATEGYQVWSRRYDRQLEDVFAVQDEIAGEVVKLLRTGRGDTPSEDPARAPIDFETYSLYLQGRYHLNRQSRASFHSAIDCFTKALARSPGHARAWGGLAAAWLYLSMFAMEAPWTTMPKASEAAAHAVAADDQDAEVLAAAATMKAMFEWDWYGAESLFRRALLASPANGYPKHLYALFVLLPLARLDEALEMVDAARRHDPLSLFASANCTAVLLRSRRVDEAEAESRRALELNPDFWRAMVALGRCHEARGHYDDAIACFEHARALSEGVASATGALGRAYALAGRTQDARALLKQLDEEARSRYVSAYNQVLIYLGLGDEQVFDWLERCCNERAAWLMFLSTDSRFDCLRPDPRFQNLLKKMGLPQVDPTSN